MRACGRSAGSQPPGVASAAVASSRSWPDSAEELRLLQRRLAGAQPADWRAPARPYAIGGCYVCFAHGARGLRDELGWAGAAVVLDSRIVAGAVASGRAPAGYEAGLLALREGPLLGAAVRALGRAPEVLLVNATGRDHPRGAGLGLHLGAVLDLPTVGVTHRPLLARGQWPADEPGAHSDLVLDGVTVGCWLRTRRRARPLAVHPGWQTDLDTACAVVLAAVRRVRAPEPLREARRLARRARTGL
jgi:deoxyribonuclease V